MTARFVRTASLALLVAAAPVMLPPALAQTLPAEEPTTAPDQTIEALQVVVVEVQGTVRVRMNRDAEWQPATVDMILGEDAELRTGPRSSVTCAIPPDQVFTLDRLGTVSVLEAVRDGKTVKTDLALKYGRVRLDVQAAGVEHRAVIRSPSSTLAVRGTDVVLYDQPPYKPVAQSYTGKAMFGYAKRVVPVGGKAFAQVEAGSSGAAETALVSSVVDPRSGLARTPAEQQLINNEISRGAVLTFDPIANISVIRGGAGPLPDSQFAMNPPGALNFFLRWSGNADLNLTVTFQPGDGESILLSGNFQPTELLYPGYSLDTTASGGRIAFDHRGGPNGGTETGYWPSVQPGLYGVSARNISGDTANFKWNVIADGQPVTIYTQELTKGTQIQRSISAGQEIVGIILVPPSALLESIFPDDTPVVGSTVTPSSIKASKKTASNRRNSLSKVQAGPTLPVQPVGPRAKNQR